MVQYVIPWCDCMLHIFTTVHRVITMVHNGNTMVYRGTIKVYHGTTCHCVVNYFYHDTSCNNHGVIPWCDSMVHYFNHGTSHIYLPWYIMVMPWYTMVQHVIP